MDSTQIPALVNIGHAYKAEGDERVCACGARLGSGDGRHLPCPLYEKPRQPIFQMKISA